MEFLWWQMCLITLCKGIAWTMPVVTLFLGIAWLINYVTKDAEKVDKAMSRKD
jgi:hypothetical protein